MPFLCRQSLSPEPPGNRPKRQRFTSSWLRFRERRPVAACTEVLDEPKTPEFGRRAA